MCGSGCSTAPRDDVLDVERLIVFSSRMNECGLFVGEIAAPLLADSDSINSLHDLRSWPENNPEEILSQIALLVRDELSGPDKVESTSEHFSDPIRRKLGATAGEVLDLPAECRGVFHEYLADILYRGFTSTDSGLIIEMRSRGYTEVHSAKMTMLHYLFAATISEELE